MDQLLIIPVDRKRPKTFRICVILGLTALMLLAAAFRVPVAAVTDGSPVPATISDGVAAAGGSDAPTDP
jgi:hypothetical protein